MKYQTVKRELLLPPHFWLLPALPHMWMLGKAVVPVSLVRPGASKRLDQELFAGGLSHWKWLQLGFTSQKPLGREWGEDAD